MSRLNLTVTAILINQHRKFRTSLQDLLNMEMRSESDDQTKKQTNTVAHLLNHLLPVRCMETRLEGDDQTQKQNVTTRHKNKLTNQIGVVF